MISMVLNTPPILMSFKQYPELKGNLLARSTLGELWEHEGKQYLLEKDSGYWLLTDADETQAEQWVIVRSMRLCLEHGIDPTMANLEMELWHKVGWGDVQAVVYRSYLSSVTRGGDREYLFNQDEGKVFVIVPKDHREPCTCTCDDFDAEFEEEMDSGADEQYGEPYTCNHINAVAELDEHRSDRRIRRADLFEPCEYWN